MDLTITLITPVTVDGVTHESLTLADLTVDQFILLEKQNKGKTPREQDRAFYAMSCGVPPDVIGAICHRDFQRLHNRYMDTLGNVELEPETSE